MMYCGVIYNNLANLCKKPEETIGQIQKDRLVEWRSQQSVVRLDKPTRLDRARGLGYKAKQGVVVVRVKVKRGGRKTPAPPGGRKPKSSGRFFTPSKSKQSIAEERAAKRFPNLEALNSYWVGEDGRHKWFECILVDKHHPAIKKDKDLGWIKNNQHTGRVHRGLTSSGKKSRGLRNRGKGSEKLRPSLRANENRGK